MVSILFNLCIDFIFLATTEPTSSSNSYFFILYLRSKCFLKDSNSFYCLKSEFVATNFWAIFWFYRFIFCIVFFKLDILLCEIVWYLLLKLPLLLLLTSMIFFNIKSFYFYTASCLLFKEYLEALSWFE